MKKQNNQYTIFIHLFIIYFQKGTNCGKFKSIDTLIIVFLINYEILFLNLKNKESMINQFGYSINLSNCDKIAWKIGQL